MAEFLTRNLTLQKTVTVKLSKFGTHPTSNSSTFFTSQRIEDPRSAPGELGPVMSS